MRYANTILTALALLLCCAGVSYAHRVNVFAYVDGDAVQVECSFSKSQKVRHGKLTITDLTTGGKLLEGTTDELGVFRFQPDAAFLKTGHGMNILLNAGEGHQNNWQIAPEELAALSPASPSRTGQQAAPAQPTASERPAAQSQPAALGQSGQTPQEVQPQTVATSAISASMGNVNIAELEAVIGKVLDAKLAPIKQALARQEDGGPNVRDIVGGIGWILGLLGLATYMKYRR